MVIKCIWATCKYNSSKFQNTLGICNNPNGIELLPSKDCDNCQTETDFLVCKNYEYDITKYLKDK